MTDDLHISTRNRRCALLRTTALAGGALVVLLLAGAVPAAAQTDYRWLGNTTDGTAGVASDWNVASNWLGGVVPPANQGVSFRAAGSGSTPASDATLNNSSISLASLSLASRNLNLNNSDITVSGIVTLSREATITAGPVIGSISIGNYLNIQGTNSAGGTPENGNAPIIFLQTNSGRTAEIRGTSLFYNGSNHTALVFGGRIVSGSSVQNGNTLTETPGNFSIGIQHGVSLTLSGGLSSNTITSARFTVTSEPNSANVPNFVGNTVLTGDNSGWVGGADVRKGTLQFGDGVGVVSGTLANRFIGGSLTVASGAKIAFNHTDTVTLNNQISGDGAIVKLGSGLLTLNNLTGFTGALNVNAGTLTLGNGVTLANSTAVTVLAGASFIYGNTLQVAQLAGATLGTSDLIVDAAAAEAFTGALSGARKLEKKSDGTLTLSGVLSYSGLTTITGGTLELTNAGNSLTGGIIVNGKLIIGATGATGGAANTITTTGSVISYANGVTSATPININSNTTQLEVLNADAAIQSGVISETGGPRGFEKIGTGTLTLAANNSYSGATVISAGTLLAGSSFNAVTPTSALGNDSATNIVRLNGGTLQVDNQDTAFARPVEITAANGTINNVANLTLNGATTFTGLLSKTGGGALILNAAGTGAGGLYMQAGSLQIGNGAALGTGTLRMAANTSVIASSANVSIANAVVLDGTTFVSTPTNTTLGLTGAISGVGRIDKTNPGTLNISGANSFSGGFGLNAGTLGVGSSTALGTGQFTVATSTTVRALSDVTLANAIRLTPSAGFGTANPVFDTNGKTITLNGVISSQAVAPEQTGYGLTKSGAGTLVLNGTNTYTGATVVSAGKLVVNGSIQSSSGLTVAAGAELGGNGATPTLTVNGTISPGNSVGVLNINGGLILGAGSTTVIEIEGSTADRINVAGNAVINGTLQLVAAAAPYKFSSPYIILTATGARTGTFATVNTTGSFGVGVTSTVAYGASDIQLTLTAAPLVNTPAAGVLGLTQTRNITAVASGLDRAVAAGADVSSLFAVYNQPTREALAAAVNSLSGEIHTSASAIGYRSSDQFLRVMLDPFAIGRDGTLMGGGASAFTADLPGRKGPVPAPSARVLVEPTYNVWAATFGATGTTNGDAGRVGSAKRDLKDANIAVGADFRVLPGTAVGFALSGGQANAKLSNGMGSMDADIFQAGIYGSSQMGALRLGVSASYGSMQIQTRRSIVVLGQSVFADYRADVLGGRLQAAYEIFNANGFTISPFAVLQVQSVHTPNFREINGLTGLGAGVNGLGRTNTALRSELGIKGTAVTIVGGRRLTLFTELGWGHDYLRDMTFAATLSSVPSAGFVVAGARQDRDVGLFSAGFDYQLTPNTVLGGRFDGSASSNARTYAGSASVRMSF